MTLNSLRGIMSRPTSHLIRVTSGISHSQIKCSSEWRMIQLFIKLHHLEKTVLQKFQDNRPPEPRDNLVISSLL